MNESGSYVNAPQIFKIQKGGSNIRTKIKNYVNYAFLKFITDSEKICILQNNVDFVNSHSKFWKSNIKFFLLRFFLLNIFFLKTEKLRIFYL